MATPYGVAIDWDQASREARVGEESDSGLRELDPVTGEIVGLEFWQASHRLPAEFLRMLPPPQVDVAAA
jgi:hypothetical protein